MKDKKSSVTKIVLILIGAFVVLLTAIVTLALILSFNSDRSNFENKSETTEDTQASNNTSDAKLVQKTKQYIADSNQLLNDGKPKESLFTLYDCQESVGDSDLLGEAIDDYFDRISFTLSVDPGTCDEEHCFKDTTYPDVTDCTPGDIGLMLVDKTSGIKVTLARITLYYTEGFYPPSNEDLTIVGHKGDTWLFYTFSGEGMSSAFLYTIHSNKLVIIEDGPPIWEIHEDILIGQSFPFGVGDPADLYAYDWTGTLLYKKQNLCGNAEVYNNSLYYATNTPLSETFKYEIHKMNFNGTEDQKCCTIELSQSSYLSVDGDSVRWFDGDKEGSMKLSELKDITFSQKPEKESAPPAKENIQTTKPQNQNVSAEKDAAIVVTLKWEQKDVVLDFNIELSEKSPNKASWNGNTFSYPDGTVLAKKSSAKGKQTISIFKTDELYNFLVDDLTYSEHWMNYIPDSNLTITKNGKTITNDISPYVYRSYTGFWYSTFAIHNGQVKENPEGIIEYPEEMLSY